MSPYFHRGRDACRVRILSVPRLQRNPLPVRLTSTLHPTQVSYAGDAFYRIEGEMFVFGGPALVGISLVGIEVACA